MSTDELLHIAGLKVWFPSGGDGSSEGVEAIDEVSLTVREGEIVGLVGESGCGKTTLALSVLGLLDKNARIGSGGEIVWSGKNLLQLSDAEMRRYRGKEIAMIFQQPQMALNPMYKVGRQMVSLLRLHHRDTVEEPIERAASLLKRVRIPDPQRVLGAYPHELSGGMAQRVMLAMALSCQPKLLIADEPTASLDVTIQAQIMDLLLEIRQEFGMAILMVSHDLGVVARLCERVAVMYLGRIVEIADTKDLYAHPFHPYTQALLDAVPLPDPEHQQPAPALKEDAPLQNYGQTGCRFRSRCPHAFDKCSQFTPVLTEVNENQQMAACWLSDYGTWPSGTSHADRTVNVAGSITVNTS